jgi:hypothetical protein
MLYYTSVHIFNTKYIVFFVLSKNDKISQKDEISTPVQCSSLFNDDKSRMFIFIKPKIQFMSYSKFTHC